MNITINNINRNTPYFCSSYQPKRLAQRDSFEFQRKKGKREAPKKPLKERMIAKAQIILDRIYGSFNANKTKESDIAFAKSLESSLQELDPELLKRRDEMVQALLNEDYEKFRQSEFIHMPLEDLEVLFNFDEYGAINTNPKNPYTNEGRIIGKPAHIRKNKSLTLNYLRKSDEIEIKKFIEYINKEEFGTVFSNSARNLLDWVNFRNGEEAGYRKTGDIAHNWNIQNLKIELKNALSSLHAPQKNTDKTLIFPNGERCKLETFLNSD